MANAGAPSVREGVAIVTLDHPPVNALGAEAVAAVVRDLQTANAAPDVVAIVLTGARATFSAGADMKAFAGSAPPRSPARDVIAALDASTKPVVAAIAGNALGGGLEVALACDYRVAVPAARLALPEITRGLIPGAGGTQRLPRMIGTGVALRFILGGVPMPAAEALACGMIDAIADDDIVDAACRYAQAHATAGRRRSDAGLAEIDDAALDDARRNAPAADRGGMAQRAAIDAVHDATRVPYAHGYARERERFLELLASDQAKARMHLFFAEREAARVAGASVEARPMRSAAIVGAGTMGRGIARALADAELEVVLIDVAAANLAVALQQIADGYARASRNGRISETEAVRRLARITTATSLDAAAHAEIIVEAVYEDAQLKSDIFRALDAIAAPDALLATNTSTLDIDAVANATARPSHVVGLHFFSPAHAMRLVEVVRASATSAETLARALQFVKQLGNIGVVAANADGFIGNRMMHAYVREAEFLLEEGATPQRVDRVLRDFGFAMGPFAMLDLAGLDVGWRIRKAKAAVAPTAGRSSRIGDMLCEAGRFGQKSGAGYYRYRDGNALAIADPEVDDLIERLARIAGIMPRMLSDAEIVQRCLYPLINEAAALLASGVAQRPGDIDVVWVHGYGFPAFRGGPLWWADTVGLPPIVAQLEAFERVHGAAWTPAPLLRELAAGNGHFAGWKNDRA